MRLAHSPAEVRELLRPLAVRGSRLGLVPTMGFLHEGHLSLVRRCRQESDTVVVSIFVNPAQFGPGEDLDAYPRDPDRDRASLEAEGVDIVFMPSTAALYAPDHSTWIDVEGLTGALCGPRRPGHFRGVATVVAKLFAIVRPDLACFGQKDWQQAMVIERITRDLDLGVRIVICPTVREADGLAMSSRNAYLSESERREAPRLHAALVSGRDHLLSGRASHTQEVTDAVRRELKGSPFRLEYVELRDARSLSHPETLDGELVLAAAAHLGRTRLIDNVLINMPALEPV